MINAHSIPANDSLVLYKHYPARVTSVSDKIDIVLPDGDRKRVRLKDITLLHPGPLRSLADLTPCVGDIEEAWQLLDGEATTLRELADLLYGSDTPATAWAAWQVVMAGVYFDGTPAAIRPRPAELIAREQTERAAKLRAEQDWQAFLARLKAAELLPEDAPRLQEVERLAYQQAPSSRLLQLLELPESPASAHRFLIQVKHWSTQHNPYPQRYGVALENPALTVPPLPNETRLDLTHLSAFAIDDEGNQDPDDAISLDGERLWVHVVDVAALVAPSSELELEARARGANLYLPERVINMLPAAITERLGLGLLDTSPALSFGMHCTADGELTDLIIQPSWVRVTRLSYAAAELRLTESPFAELTAITQRFRARRLAANATTLEFPEVTVRVRDGAVQIRPLPRLASRALVAEAMLMAGTAAAQFCHAQQLPIPFALQPPPERVEQPTTLAAMFAYRRQFKPSRTSTEPGAHAGLGLPLYSRVTSPLRRYGDLLVHQQLRAAVRGEVPLTAADISARMAQADTAAAATRRAERQSNWHWKLVYLQEHTPTWRGEAVVVEQEERRTVALIPALALEVRLRARRELALDQVVQVAVAEVDVPELECRFQVRE